MKILIVEDDAFFRNFYMTKLKEKEFEVDIAINGQDALNKIKEQKPDLILLDIIMPVVDGFEVLTQLKAANIVPPIPVLVFSTLGQESDIAKAKSLGAADFINKSFFDFEIMYKKILNCLHPI